MILKQILKKSFRAIFLVIVVLSLLEGVLWLVNTPSNILYTDDSSGLLQMNKNLVLQLSLNESASTLRFKKEKGKNTFRIFIVGQKVNNKVPHNPNTSFTHILNYKLQHIFKDKNIELINIAFNSPSSFELAKVCRQLKNYEPDLVMICPGKNEFDSKNAYPYTVLMGNPELDGFLCDTYIYQGIKNLLTFGKTSSSEYINSSIFKKTIENFEIKLEKMVIDLHDNDIPVILVNNTSNMLDTAPQKGGFSSPDSSFLTKIFEEGEAAYANSDYEKASACFTKVFRKERYHAQTLFYLGKLALRDHDLKAAQKFFKEAIDNDPVKLRTPSQINNVIFRIACTRNCPLIDTENLFLANSTLGIPGYDLFCDEQNLNLQGNLLLADNCLKTIFMEGYLSKSEYKNQNYESQVAITPFDSIFDQYYSKCYGQPFTDVSTTFEELIVNLFAEKKNSWEESMNKLYDYYIQNKNYRMAFKTIENLVLENPYNVTLNDKASRTAAIIGDSQQVIRYASRVYKMKPDTEIAERLVISYLKLDMPESALPYLKYVGNYTLNKKDFNFIYNATNQIIDLKNSLKQSPNDLSIRNKIAQKYYEIGNEEVAQLYDVSTSHLN